MESADVPDSKSGAERRVGSSPTIATIFEPLTATKMDKTND